MLSLIAAVACNRVIGRHGNLPWKLPVDMAHFKRTTTGKAVIMGRKTFESLGRALPGRENVVLSRDSSFSAPGCIVVASVDEAIERTRHFDEAVVIGGSMIYEAFFPRAERLYLTWIDADVTGDVYFPDFNPGEWREIARRDVAADERHAHAFSIVTLERRDAGILPAERGLDVC